jgi:hypothetical protein
MTEETGETEGEQALRHMREGQKNVTRQQAVVERLRRDGHDTTQAEALLKTFWETLQEHVQHVDLLRREGKL